MVKSTIKAVIKIRNLMLVFLLLIAKPSFSQQPKIDKNAAAALKTVDTNRIKSVITYLADDKLKGRLPGEEGFKMASDYLPTSSYKVSGNFEGSPIVLKYQFKLKSDLSNR